MATRLAAVLPAGAFTFEAFGSPTFDGKAVRCVAAVGWTAVRLTITAPTPEAGTVPRPRTVRARVPPPAMGPPPENWPSTVG